MLKFAILLFNTLALLIYQFLFTEGVTVTQNVPASAKAESEFTIELTIQKGATVGFAKLQQELPAGFTAVEDKNNGASFSFSNQTVKFIWMSLPNDAEFKVSYKVKVAAGVSGDQTIAGKFSYVTDNAKQSYDIVASTITIGGEGEVASNETPTTETPTTETPTTETPTTETPTTETPKSNTSAEASPFSCIRKVPGTASGEFTVEITVNKGNLSGFAKLMEVLPYGFTATAMESAGASFSFADQKARFIWVSMPAQPEFKISYKVKVTDVSGDQVIDGVFSYIENDQTQKFVLQTSTVAISGEGASQITKIDDTKVDDTKVDDTKVDDTKVDDTKVDDNMSATKIPTPMVGAYYKVQIMALQKERTASFVAKYYNLSPSKIDLRAEVGVRKYLLTTSHTVYKDARDERERVKDGIVRVNVQAKQPEAPPFVVAYNNGRRITVQEALMASNQQWYR